MAEAAKHTLKEALMEWWSTRELIEEWFTIFAHNQKYEFATCFFIPVNQSSTFSYSFGVDKSFPDSQKNLLASCLVFSRTLVNFGRTRTRFVFQAKNNVVTTVFKVGYYTLQFSGCKSCM